MELLECTLLRAIGSNLIQNGKQDARVQLIRIANEQEAHIPKNYKS
jgi:hypothetical protein